jgi:chromosome segregation ATPase
MATSPDTDETKVASHTLAYLRSLDRKLDLVIDVLQRQGERLARLERDQGETRRDLGEIRRDITEVKGDIALLDNKIVTAQTEILTVLHRLDQGADRTKSDG